MIITEEKYNEELTRYVLPFIRLNFEDGYMKSADGTRIHSVNPCDMTMAAFATGVVT